VRSTPGVALWKAHNVPASPVVTSTAIQASMAPAVTPANGTGDTYQFWCPARYAQAPNALIFPSPPNKRPGVFQPVRRRLMSER